MNTDGRSSGSPVLRQVSTEDVPPGFWARNEHFSFPLTPLSADVLVSENVNSLHVGSEEVTGLRRSSEAVFITGYLYFGPRHAERLPAELAALEEKVRNGYERRQLRRWYEETRPKLLKNTLLLQAVRPASLDDRALRDHFRALQTHKVECSRAHFADLFAAHVVIGRCALFCRKHLGLTTPDLLELLAGYSPVSRGPVAALDELAAQALKRGDILAALESQDAWASEAFAKFVHPWLETYGHRLVELELRFPTLAEQPQRVLKLLREAIDAAKQGAHDAQQRVRTATAARVDALRARLGNDTMRTEVDRLVLDAQEAYGVRDDDVGFLFWTSGLVRRVVLEAGRRLTAQRVLSDADLIWYLRGSELWDAMDGSPAPDLNDRAAQRMTEHVRWQTETPAASYGTPPGRPSPLPASVSDAARRFMEALAASNIPVAGPSSLEPLRDASVTRVQGLGASRGTYTGVARLVRGEAEFDRIQPGDVVVCPITSSAWNVVLGRVGAIVTDQGGILSHPAIIAREFGVPGVVGTQTATQVLPDGAMVEVDGGAGTVCVLG